MIDKILKKEALIYGVGHIVSRLIPFLLLPLFTNLLTTYEYGIVSLVYTFLAFFTVILHVGLDSALLRHYKPAEVEEKKKYVTNVYIILIGVNIVVLFILFLFKNTLSSFLLGPDLTIIFILMIFILCFDGLWAIPMIIFRADNMPWKFITCTLINVISHVLFLSIYTMLYDFSIFGIIFSNFLSSMLLFIITLPGVIKKIKVNTFNINILKRLFQFGFPLLFAAIFSMIIELSDRYIIKYLLDVEMVGIYNAGYKLGMMMLLVVMGFNMAWQPFFMDKNNQKKSEKISSISNRIFIVFSIVCCLIICFVDPLSNIKIFGYKIIGDAFVSSMNIVPLVCLGYLFHGAYVLMLPGPLIKKKTISMATIRGVGALSNILLNFYLIPFWGLYGAAFATCLSFFIMIVLLFLYNKTISDLQYKLNTMVSCVFVVFLMMCFVNYNPSLISRCLMIILLPVILFLLGAFTNREVYLIKNRLNEIFNK